MRLPGTDREAIDRLKNHFISKMIPGVGTWGELDALRGWKDDFLGDQLADQYTAVSSGAGSSGALLNNYHGGAYLLTAGAGAGFFHYLWLGDAADGFATLDADIGWLMLARCRMSHITNIVGDFGALDSAHNNIIQAGISTAAPAGNWLLVTRTGGGAVNNVNSGIAADTDTHWHALNVYPITGGRQVDYFLDGIQIATTTVSVPTIVLTPLARCRAVAAAARAVTLDYWGVIPRNLA